MAWQLSSYFLFQSLWELPIVYCIKSEPICLVCKVCNNLTTLPNNLTSQGEFQRDFSLLLPAALMVSLTHFCGFPPRLPSPCISFYLNLCLEAAYPPLPCFVDSLPTLVFSTPSTSFLTSQSMYYLIAQIEPLIISFLGL